ncbi:MAG: cation diffusion facilitator family transporter [Candidatus Moranbacteria bacterium]|nr:cation diffusion facilitator family transporter [Candidatus Moranbacteria bacterium]
MFGNVSFVAILGFSVNFLLTVFKIIAGLITGSVAVLAEGVHSAADVFSSGVAWWGIRKSKKEPDKEHPYGYAKYEMVATFVVVGLLYLGAVWILFEAVNALIHQEQLAGFSLLNISIMGASVVLNEVMAQIKFRVGGKAGSSVLVADGQHDRADVIASVGVLAGLLLVKWFPLADIMIALIVGVYIIKEAWGMTGETVGSLVDKSNPELEKKVERYLKDKNFSFEEIKTRKIGSTNFAEVFLLCEKNASMEEVDKITSKLKENMLEDIEELSYLTISVKSHQVSSGVFEPRFWGRFGYRRGFQKVGPKKMDYRVAVPLVGKDKEEINPNEFGAEYYLILDFQKNQLKRRRIQKNPYFEQATGKGVKFIKSVEADKAIAKYMGKGAKENLQKLGVEVEVVDKKARLEEVIKGM